MSTCDRLQCDTSIPQGFCVVSPSEEFYLKVQEDGNLVFFNITNEVLWSSNSAGKSPGPYYLRMRMDGNLCLYGENESIVWSSGTEKRGTPPFQIKVRNEGDCCLFDTTGKKIWSTSG